MAVNSRHLKTAGAVAGSLVGLWLLLSIPGAGPPVAPAPRRGRGFGWNQDTLWRSLETTYVHTPLVAACPRYLRDYVRLSGRLREAVKWQSRRWDVASDGARARLYRSLYGFRGAVGEGMLQHPDSSLPLPEGRREPSATPAVHPPGVEIPSGRIPVS